MPKSIRVPSKVAKTRAPRTLSSLGEFGFLDTVLPHLKQPADVIVGPGDDCAVIRPNRARAARLLFTIDALVEGTHFQSGWLSPYQLGRKAFLVNASDIAAMGGQPRYALVAIAAPAQTPVVHLTRLQAGVVDAAASFGASVVGGNLTAARHLSITIALWGDSSRRFVTRGGAQAGDYIYVTGTVGEAASAVQWLTNGSRGIRPRAALRRFAEPAPRSTAGMKLAQSGIASAMIDVSDGLVQDLTHICIASGCAAQIDIDKVPCTAAVRKQPHLALAGGEDYELLFTVPAGKVRRLERIQGELGCAITCIGRIVPRSSRAPKTRVRLLRHDGSEVHLGSTGYDHFRRRPKDKGL